MMKFDITDEQKVELILAGGYAMRFKEMADLESLQGMILLPKEVLASWYDALDNTKISLEDNYETQFLSVWKSNISHIVNLAQRNVQNFDYATLSQITVIMTQYILHGEDTGQRNMSVEAKNFVRECLQDLNGRSYYHFCPK